MCILCVASRWSRRIVTMLPCLVIPLLILWAVSQVLPPGFRFEVTSSRLACVFVLLISLGWYEIVMPRLSSWRARRSALLRDRRRAQALEAAKWRKEATRRCRNCLTAYRDQIPAGGRFMCTYCGHVSRRPVLDIPGVTSGIVSPRIPTNGAPLQGGITQIGIPVASLYGGKNVGAWNGKGWPVRACWSKGKSRMGDSSWPSEWPVSDSWLRGSLQETSNYFGGNVNMFGDVFRGSEKCSAGDSNSGVLIFLLRFMGFFFFCIRWIWRRIFRKGSLGEDEALNSGQKPSCRKGEDVCHSQGNKGEKARRKAEEKRQARLEKEMREEEERKQREEVARLVEERRRLRDEKLKAEKESEMEAAAEREREIRREREAERRRQDKVKEKEKGLGKDKVQADGGEAKKRAKENEKKVDADKKGENEKGEILKGVTQHVSELKKGTKNFKVFSVETGLKGNEHGMKGVNNTCKVVGSRYLGPVKGSFQSPKSSAWHPSNATSLWGKSFGTVSRFGVKSGKPATSGEASTLSITDNPVGCKSLKSAQSMGPAWTKAWGKGSGIATQNVFRQEDSATSSKVDIDVDGFGSEKSSDNGADKSPEIKHSQTLVGFELPPLSPVSTQTNSWEHPFASPSTSWLTAGTNVLGSPVEQDHWTDIKSKPVALEEVKMCSSTNQICFGSSPVLVMPSVPMPMLSNSVVVPDSAAKSLNSYNHISPARCMSPDNLVTSEVDSFEDLPSAPNSVSLFGPVSESLTSFSFGLENNVSSDIGTAGVLSPRCAPIAAPVQRPAPIESPISKLLPSEIVDEVHVTGDQLRPITEPWGLRSLSLDTPNDVSKQGKWQMWGTPQLVQNNLATRFEHSPWLLPPGNGMLEREKDLVHPLSERPGQSPFEPESHLPSCLFSPRENPNSSNQSNGDFTGVAAVSNSNSLWLNQPAFESAMGTWVNLDQNRVPPRFVNCGAQGKVLDSVITADGYPHEQSPVRFWFKSGIEDGINKSNWSAETEVQSSSWSTAIKSSARPHIGGIYSTPDVQSVWSYK
eukprot:Gb_14464 [translate_table: standard]